MAKPLKAEGWKWVRGIPSPDCFHEFERVRETRQPTAEQQEAIDRLMDERMALDAELDAAESDEQAEAIQEKQDVIDAKLEAIEGSLPV